MRWTIKSLRVALAIAFCGTATLQPAFAVDGFALGPPSAQQQWVPSHSPVKSHWRRSTSRRRATALDDMSENDECSIEDIERLRGGGATQRSRFTGQQRFLFLFTYLAYVAIYFARKPMSVVKPVLETELGVTREALSRVDTSLLGAYAVGQLMIAQISRVLSSRRMLSLSFLLCGLATMGLGLAHSVPAFSCLSAVAGFTAACANPLLVIFISDIFPPSMRASVVGLWQTSQQAGGIAANNGAALLLAWKGWRSVFLGSGLLVAVFSPLLFLLLKKPPSSPAAVVAPASKKGSAEQSSSSYSDLLRLPGVISMSSAYMLVKMARYCLMLWLPTFFTSRVGMSAASAGAMASIFDAGGVLGGVCAGLVTDTLVGGRMLLATLPFCGLGSLSFFVWALLNGKGELVNAVCMAVSGFLIAGPDGVLGGAASKNLCDYLGKGSSMAPAVSGLVNGIASIGVIAMSAFTTKLVDVVGWSGLFAVIGSMMALASVVLAGAITVELRHFAKQSPDAR